MPSKAFQLGQKAGQSFAMEHPDEVEQSLKPDQLGADDALINAMGVEESAKWLGVKTVFDRGMLTDEADQAFDQYAKGFLAALVKSNKANQEGAPQ